MSVSLSVTYVHASVLLSVCASGRACLPDSLPDCLSVYLSVCPSVSVCLCVCVSVCLAGCLSVKISLYNLTTRK